MMPLLGCDRRVNDLIRALGIDLDKRMVKDVTISIRADEAVTITTIELVTGEQAGSLIDVIKRYELHAVEVQTFEPGDVTTHDDGSIEVLATPNHLDAKKMLAWDSYC